MLDLGQILIAKGLGIRKTPNALPSVLPVRDLLGNSDASVNDGVCAREIFQLEVSNLLINSLGIMNGHN